MNLLNNFRRHLDAEIAVNDSQRIEAHRLRYEIYCEDRGYENSAAFSDGLEKDEFDANSIHGLVRHKHSNQVAGVVRLILSDTMDPENPLYGILYANFLTRIQQFEEAYSIIDKFR